MNFGVSIFPTRYSIGPAELARAVEERGFESLFFPEHTHIPTSRRSPWPGGADLPDEYRETLDPFLALTAAAAVHRAAPPRHGHLPRRRARPDHHRQGGGHPRPPLRRPLPLRRRRRLEPGGDGEPRHRPDHALRRPPGTGPGHEGDLDQRRGRVPRHLRRLRPGLAVAQARPAAPPAGAGGRATGRARWSGCSSTATAGSRSPAGARSTLGEGTTRLQELAAERGRRPDPGHRLRRPPGRRRSSPTTPRSGVDRALFALPSVETAEALKLLDTYANLAETDRS